jgi:ABC-type Zn uptake system ZnuABC Zn-binding protein ZnuA
MKDVCRLLALVFTMFFILSCGSGSPAPKAKDLPQGRAETKVVEGATAVGYNGSQMRKKIDKTLDQNDERNKEIEKAAGSAPSK